MDEDLYQTFEELEDELIEVEGQLGMSLNLPHPYRQALLELDKKNRLKEDEMVMEWHRLYATYMDWKRWKARNK